MNPRIPAGLAVVGLAFSAVAQAPSFIYHFDVANPNLNPGQSTTVTVLCGFSPGVGQLVSTPVGPRPVLGLSAGAFNIVGSGSGASWSAPALVPPYNFLSGQYTLPGTIAGLNVTGVVWSAGFGPLFVHSQNPAPVWTGTFTMGTTHVVLQVNPVGSHGVWAGYPMQFPVESVSTQTTGAQAIINVVPAPAAGALITLAALVQRRRRHAGAAP